MENLLILLVCVVLSFVLGGEFGHNRLYKRYKRERIDEKRYDLKQSGLQSVPYNHAENLEATFTKDIYGNREFKLATLIVTSPSGRRFVVDSDLRSNDGTAMKLTSFASEPVDSINSYISNIDVVDVISNSIDFEAVSEIEKYYAFQKTIDDINRGRHWLSKGDLASVEVRFFDLTYAELRTIADQESYVFYSDTVKTLTKTEELFNRVNNTIVAAEASLSRCDEMVNIGKEVIRDIIADTINTVRSLASKQNDLMLAYAVAVSSNEEFISEEEWKDIKIFTAENNSNVISLKEVEAIVNKNNVINMDVMYEIASDSEDFDPTLYKNNRKRKENKKSKKRNKKQRRDLDN